MQNLGDHSISRQSIVQAHRIARALDINPSYAIVLVMVHNVSRIEAVAELLVSDPDAKLSHIFMERVENDTFCGLCEKQESEHLQSDRVLVQSIQDAFILLEEISSDDSDERRSYKQFRQPGYPRSFGNSSDGESDEVGPLKECEVCANPIHESRLFLLKGVRHPICLDCMNKFLTQKIVNGQVRELKCPHCTESLNGMVIREIVDERTFIKYAQFVKNLTIMENPKLRWCPNPKCAIVLQSKSTWKSIKCAKCGTKACAKCFKESHTGVSCERNMRRQIEGWEDSQSLQTCKKCKSIVTKASGCNHMTCQVCKFEWCWLCGSSYSRYHYSSMNPLGCPGMQHADEKTKSIWKIYGCRVLIWLVLIVLSPIAAVGSLIFAGPVVVGNFFISQCGSSCCALLVILPISLVFGLAIDPIVWIVLAVMYIPRGCCKLIQFWREKREVNDQANRLIRQKLLNDALLEDNFLYNQAS